MKDIARVSILLAAFAGCASQAAPGYDGEPLFSMTGTVVNQLAIVPARTEVVLAGVALGVTTTGYWETVATQGEFPAAFTLDTYNPPPVDLANTVFATSGVLVVQTDDDGNTIANLGQLADHTLIYITGVGSVSFENLDTLAPGYHLLEEILPPPTPSQIADCTTSMTSEKCTADDAAAYCAQEAGTLQGGLFLSSHTYVEVPQGTPLTITLDGMPCGWRGVP